MTTRVLARLCHTNDCCPTVIVDDTAQENRQVRIEDDFGNTAHMSKGQFALLVDLAKKGTFESL